MKIKQFFAKHILTVVVCLALVFIGLLLNYARHITDEAVIESTFDEMNQIGFQYQVLLSQTLEEASDDLLLFADFVVNNNIDHENIVAYMNSQSHAAKFSQLYYIELDGSGLSKENEYADFSDNESFKHALKNEMYVEDPYISLQTSEVVFDLAVPVIKNGEPIAVLFSKISVNEFFETILQNKDYEGDIFFVDDKLNMIFSTSSNHLDAIIIPEEDVAEMGMPNVIQAQTNLANDQSGGFYYDYFGIPKVMVYYPIELTNVAFAMNVHVESISSEILKAADYFTKVGIAIYWTIVILVIYIAIMQTRSNKRILKVAYYDPLTGLPNMVKFKADTEAALTSNPNKNYTIIVFDIENFKAINEVFGYKTGDLMLTTINDVADMINQPSLITARIGDDKFAMFAESFVLEDLSTILANVTELYDKTIPELKDYAAKYKIGRYKIENNETNIDEIMSKVILAHNKARRTNGEPVCDYDDIFKKTLQAEAEITNKMTLALENKEFQAFLQPKFAINENELIGAEALARWIEADDKMIYPNDFIPLFERNGFIVELDNYILEQVCITLRKWLDQGLHIVPISVNCSRLNLHNPNFVQVVAATADKYNVPHEYIEIELTESNTIESEQTIEQLFESLHKEGFRISIDDFGAGYSSLGMLTSLQVDTLKMDRSFFVGSKNARRDDLLIDSIVKMAHNLNMYVVAEGIETKEQVELLQGMNCDAIQGYYYDKPMPISQFEEKYRASMQKFAGDKSAIPLVNRINDIKYASTFVPSGILVVKLDEHFTLAEANDYYFDMIGYTREEVRDIFNNRGILIMDAQKRIEILEYFNRHLQENPDGLMNFTTQFTIKSGAIHTYNLSGKIAISENGEPRLYASVTDITNYIMVDAELQFERDFNTRIAALTNNAFFDYDKETDTIHFSKDFAEKFNIPNIIENLSISQLFPDFLPVQAKITQNETTINKGDGEFFAKLANGEPTWYIYSYKTIYDQIKQKEIIVGRMMEAAGHKAELDILKVKSETDPSINIFDQQATNRYISNYLKIATDDNEAGAFLVIDLMNWNKLKSSFGQDYTNAQLSEVANIIRSMFRSADLIGRAFDDKFFVFINNYKTIEFVERKTIEICTALTKSYQKEGITLHITASIGISLYPEHGDSFTTLYEKANLAIQTIAENDQYRFALYADPK